MNTIVICFIVLYLFTLINYFFSETSGNFKRRAINKIILASLFLVFGIIQYSLHYEFFSYHLILLFAIICAFLGDVILLYSFTKGGITFIISNILFFIYEWIIVVNNNVSFKSIWWFIIMFILFAGTFALVAHKKIIDLLNKKIPILAYVCSVTLQGTLGICLALYFLNYKMMLFGFGLALFMISDYFLMVHKFKYRKKNWVLRCNSGTYFIGLLLVVLSLMY